MTRDIVAPIMENKFMLRSDRANALEPCGNQAYKSRANTIGFKLNRAAHDFNSHYRLQIANSWYSVTRDIVAPDHGEQVYATSTDRDRTKALEPCGNQAYKSRANTIGFKLNRAAHDFNSHYRLQIGNSWYSVTRDIVAPIMENKFMLRSDRANALEPCGNQAYKSRANTIGFKLNRAAHDFNSHYRLQIGNSWYSVTRDIVAPIMENKFMLRSDRTKALEPCGNQAYKSRANTIGFKLNRAAHDFNSHYRLQIGNSWYSVTRDIVAPIMENKFMLRSDRAKALEPCGNQAYKSRANTIGFKLNRAAHDFNSHYRLQIANVMVLSDPGYCCPDHEEQVYATERS